MTTYYVNSAASGANNGTGWPDAWVSPNSLPSLASNDIVYFADASVDAYGYVANKTITGPASGAPAKLISVTAGTTTYSKSSSAQFNIGGTYTLTFDGSFALYGIKAAAGGSIILGNDTNEDFYTSEFTAAVGADSSLQMHSGSGARSILENLTIDLTADGTTSRANPIISMGPYSGTARIHGLTLVNPGYRTGTLVSSSVGYGLIEISGADLSGLAASCELTVGSGMRTVITNCKLSASAVHISGNPYSGSEQMLTSSGAGFSPSYLSFLDYIGSAVSSTAVYRTGGAQVEGAAAAWLITTTSVCAEGSAFRTPWIYGSVSSTGAKTFTLCITNDTANFTDAEVWLEVDYLATSGSSMWTRASDHRATITTAAAAQDADASTWVGSPSFGYKQKLVVSTTIGQAGHYRARVVVGFAGTIAASRNVYADPIVVVA